MGGEADTDTQMSLVIHFYHRVSRSWVGDGRADPCLRARRPAVVNRCQMERMTEQLLRFQVDPLDVSGRPSSSNGPEALWRQMREKLLQKIKLCWMSLDD